MPVLLRRFEPYAIKPSTGGPVNAERFLEAIDDAIKLFLRNVRGKDLRLPVFRPDRSSIPNNEPKMLPNVAL